MDTSAVIPKENAGNGAGNFGTHPQWQLRRRLVLDVTRYLMWGLPVIIFADLIFGSNLVQTLGGPALTGIIGLPGSYLVGRSVQTAIRERQAKL